MTTPATSAGGGELEGKVALVTGGSRGLGREMARALARAGAEVIVVSRRLASCEEVAAELRAETGRRSLALACHVGRWAECDALVERAYDEMGRVDVLINNAGMAPRYPSLAEVSEELWDKVQAVNLKGPFRLTALIGSRMAAGDGGTVVNISSIAAVRPGPGDLPYAAAKAGLNTLTTGFAAAYGPSVRVNGIMAGPFTTDIAQHWDVEGFGEWAEQRYPLGRLGHPPEIVGTALYLATSASSFTTGQVLVVDGGVTISSPFPA